MKGGYRGEGNDIFTGVASRVRESNFLFVPRLVGPLPKPAV